MGAMATVSAGHLLFWTIIAANTGIESQCYARSQEDTMIGKKVYDAADHGDLAEVRHLIGDQCSGVNWQNPEEEMTVPLHAAALNNHTQVVKLLLSCNADPNIQTIYGFTPLMYASAASSIDVIQALLTANPDLDIKQMDGFDALIMAMTHNNLDAAKALVTAGADLNHQYDQGLTPLMMASGNNQLDFVKTLLQNGADATIKSNTGKTASDLARTKGFMDIHMLTNEALTNESSMNEAAGLKLYSASLHGDLAKVKQLTGDQCLCVNWQIPGDEMTPLHVAVINNYTQIVKLLLSCNADPNIQEAMGFTPLMAAHSIDVVQALLTAHPDIDVQDEDGTNALMYAISGNNLDITKALLTAGADPNLQYNDGQTALMMAARMNRLDHAKVLLQHGADANIISKEGYTAAYIARQLGFMDIHQLIKQHTSATGKHTPSMLVICLAVVVFIFHTGDLHDWWIFLL